MIDYEKYYEDTIRRTISFPLHPSIVEIQPSGKIGCHNRCSHCIGGTTAGVSIIESPVPLKKYRNIISRFPEMGIKRVILSGSHTEPFTYSEIEELILAIKATRAVLGVNTCGYFLTESAIHLLTSNVIHDSYVSISIDAYDPESYDRTHRPITKNCFQRLLENARKLGDINREKGSPLKINWTYLFGLYNTGDHEKIRGIIKCARESGANNLRFSSPNPPVVNVRNYTPPDEIRVREYIESIKGALETEHFKIETVLPVVQEYTFEYCYFARISRVICAEGLVYPCSAVSNGQFPQLVLSRMEDMGDPLHHEIKIGEHCNGRHCGRFERAFNLYCERNKKDLGR